MRCRAATPTSPKPATSITQSAGSGTDDAEKEPAAKVRVVVNDRLPVTLVNSGLTGANETPGDGAEKTIEKS